MHLDGPYPPPSGFPFSVWNRGTPLWTRAIFAQLALGLVLVSHVLVALAVWRQRTLVEQLRQGRPVSLAEAQLADDRAHQMWLTLLGSWMVCAIAFVVWFWTLRSNAAKFNPQGQRRSQAWAFWGWVCPIVSFWFPVQIAVDALRATPLPRSTGIRQVALWWTFFVASILCARVVTADHPTGLSGLHWHTTLELVSVALEFIAAAFAIAVVRTLTRRNDEHLARLDAVARLTPSAG